MNTQSSDQGPRKIEASKRGGKAKPEWANGLKQLYDSVVDEPLPDSFKDLLSQLDDNS